VEFMTELAQALEVAIRIERTGIDFYNTLCEMCDDATVKEFFNHLAAEEEAHVGYFRNLLRELTGHPVKFRYEGDYEKFLSMVASKSIATFAKLKDNLDIGNFDEAVNLAVDLEVDTVAYYSELAKCFEGLEKTVMIGIVESEKNHIAVIKKFREEFRKRMADKESM